MEWSSVLAALGLLAITVATVWMAKFAWWKPRRLEHAIRSQGFRGNPYRLFYGDVKDDARLTKEARSKPISPYSHDIIPRVFPLLHRSIKDYGKFSFTWTGPKPRVCIMDPKLIQEVLSDKDGHFVKPSIGSVGRLAITGFATLEGEKWAKHRRIINPAFHVDKLKLMLPAFSACCIELINRWGSLLGPDGSCELDVWPELQNFTGDVISRAAFGSSYAEGRRIFQLQVEQASLLLEAVQTIAALIPGYRFLRTKINIRGKEIDREICTLLTNIIRKREYNIKAEDVCDDLLSLLLESNSKEFEEHGNYKSGMTTEEVIGECKLFYFAGQESTSVLLTWIMVLLSMHPNWQTRAREEVFQVFGKDKPEFTGLNQLKIATMIIYEVLRLYTPASIIFRKTNKTVRLGDFTFPPDVFFSLPAIFIHRDPEIWGRDAQEFNPERFAEGISKASKNKVAFFSFGWGHRGCIGQNFTMLEAKMALSMILQNFSFELSPRYVHAPYSVLTLQPQYGAQFILHKL